ncbi:hypothetical protein DC3_32290 [Deinococcus cellulosilyticus NBRC 106333 = KACC 11606]|uniref:O-antigen ligase-related domain-containing protein n=2 Tax=Deinococcus cellulosilyticus TaxID=401558 RepID=A0A511N3Y6_DEIC1|nr:hypothetical protein DC3_32290 [Deinococcus cellulosilyticus NBRC 106333 = KACC 11606]
MGGRVFIEGFNPNGVAYYMVFTSAFLVMYKNRFVRDHIFINKIIPYVGLLILLIGVVTTGSRGGFIAEMVVVAFVLLGLLRESKNLLNRLLLISVMIVGGLTSLFYLNNYRFDVFDFQRFEELGYEITSGDFSGRGDIWRGGIQLFVDNPIYGYGGGSFREAIIASYGESIAPHNGFLATAVDLGVIGFIVIVSIWLHILILIRRNRNKNFDIMTCYVVLFMSWLSANMEYQEVNWFIFATMVSLSTAVLSKPVTTQSEALTYRVN